MLQTFHKKKKIERERIVFLDHLVENGFLACSEIDSLIAQFLSLIKGLHLVRKKLYIEVGSTAAHTLKHSISNLMQLIKNKNNYVIG